MLHCFHYTASDGGRISHRGSGGVVQPPAAMPCAARQACRPDLAMQCASCFASLQCLMSRPG